MENSKLGLEKTLSESKIERKEEKGYNGLRLVEDRAYQGPTSIKYWM